MCNRSRKYLKQGVFVLKTSRSSSRSDNFSPETIERILSHLSEISSPPDPNLPGRQVIPTYLKNLDKQWRGDWSWQWPMIIAGPSDAGKTHFAYQIIASTLLSSPSPWRALYFALVLDYRILFHRFIPFLSRYSSKDDLLNALQYRFIKIQK